MGTFHSSSQILWASIHCVSCVLLKKKPETRCNEDLKIWCCSLFDIVIFTWTEYIVWYKLIWDFFLNALQVEPVANWINFGHHLYYFLKYEIRRWTKIFAIVIKTRASLIVVLMYLNFAKYKLFFCWSNITCVDWFTALVLAKRICVVISVWPFFIVVILCST